jgi:hypothetical protein
MPEAKSNTPPHHYNGQTPSATPTFTFCITTDLHFAVSKAPGQLRYSAVGPPPAPRQRGRRADHGSGVFRDGLENIGVAAPEP